MSGQIKMTPAELTQKAGQYGQSAETIRDVLGRLESLQRELEQQWQGQAFQSFNTQFEDLRPKVTNFAQLMDDIKDQLTKTADAMEQQDQALSQNFGFR